MASSDRETSGVGAFVRSDWALAVGLFVAAEVELAFLTGLDRRAVAVLAAPFVTLPLRWRRTAPLLAAVTSVGAFAAQSAAGVDDSAQLVPMIALVVAAVCLGRHATSRVALVGTAIAVGLGALAVLATPDDTPSDYVFVVLLVVGAVAAGAALRARTSEAATQAHRAELAEERAKEAIELERRRIARELHDVVAHAISLMVLQAGAAEAVLDHDVEGARRSLRTVQDQGRAALVDMHHLLGVLRRSPDAGGFDPSPTLRDIPDLVEQFRAAGLPVSLSLDVGDAPVPSSVGVSVHRVVREALTNVVRHAGPATASVRIAVGADGVDVEVRDDGRGSGAPGGSSGGGYGLAGMRERVALFGGTMHAGPHPDGGFAVQVRFPLDALTVAP